MVYAQDDLVAEPPAYLGHLANVGVGADLRMTVAGQVRPSMLRRKPWLLVRRIEAVSSAYQC